MGDGAIEGDEMDADLEEAGELGDLEGGGGEEDLRHEGDGGAAAHVRAAALVDAETRRLGQGADAAAVEVLEHQPQRLVADLHLLAEKLSELDLVLVFVLDLLLAGAGCRGSAREEVAQEGAARAEHAAVHAEVGRTGHRDARVGEEGEVFGGPERGGEVVGQAAERLQVGVRRVGAVDGDAAVGVGERDGGDLAVHGLHFAGRGAPEPGLVGRREEVEASGLKRRRPASEGGREEGARGKRRI